MLVYMESFTGEKKIGTIHHDDAYVSNGTLGAIPAELAYIEDDSIEIDLSWENSAVVDIRARETVGIVDDYRCVEITEEEAELIRKTAGIEAAKETDAEIAELEAIIAACETQADIPAREEADRRMALYNNVYNEGGEGYVPHIYSCEEYKAAKDRLVKLEQTKRENAK